MKIVRSTEARIDLREIARYIAKDKPSAAIKFLDEIEKTLRSLSQFSGMGTARDELLPGMRSLPQGNYILFYQNNTERLLLVRVIYGARDFQSEFRA